MKGEWSKEIFARNLKRYMAEANKSQKEMAKIVGVSAPAFNEWLKAKKYPRIDKIEILADYFGILKSDLIEDKKENERTKLSETKTLPDNAKLMVELFNKVPEDKQSLVIEMIRAALKTK